MTIDEKTVKSFILGVALAMTIFLFVMAVEALRGRP